MNNLESLHQSSPIETQGYAGNGQDQNKGDVTTEAARVSFSCDGEDGTAKEAQNNPRKSPTKPRRIVVLVAVLVLIAGLVVGFIPRWRQGRTAVADMNQLAIPTVSLVSPTPEQSGNGLTLPAEIRPWREASIYARANGYLKDWVADIGAHVKAGQLLGEIETPDLDQQLAQAKAQLALAQANLHLAEITDNRWKELLKTASVSQQAAAEKAAARETAAASVEADRANIDRKSTRLNSSHG